MVILSLIDYSFILRFSWIIYLLAVGLLALVLVAGDSSKGAQRWFETVSYTHLTVGNAGL